MAGDEDDEGGGGDEGGQPPAPLAPIDGAVPADEQRTAGSEGGGPPFPDLPPPPSLPPPPGPGGPPRGSSLPRWVLPLVVVVVVVPQLLGLVAFVSFAALSFVPVRAGEDRPASCDDIDAVIARREGLDPPGGDAPIVLLWRPNVPGVWHMESDESVTFTEAAAAVGAQSEAAAEVLAEARFESARVLTFTGPGDATLTVWERRFKEPSGAAAYDRFALQNGCREDPTVTTSAEDPWTVVRVEHPGSGEVSHIESWVWGDRRYVVSATGPPAVVTRTLVASVSDEVRAVSLPG